jgi:hypothetical protein
VSVQIPFDTTAYVRAATLPLFPGHVLFFLTQKFPSGRVFKFVEMAQFSTIRYFFKTFAYFNGTENAKIFLLPF